MAGETYYFTLSLVFVLSAIFALLNLVLLRKGRTIFGVTVKPGTPEYQKGVKLASNRNMTIAVALTLIFIGNLIYDMNRLLRLDDYSPGFLLFLTGFVVLLTVLIFPFIRKQARDIYEMSKTRKQK